MKEGSELGSGLGRGSVLVSVSGFVRVQVSTAAVHIVLIISGFFKVRDGRRGWCAGLIIRLRVYFGFGLGAALPSSLGQGAGKE